MWVSRVIFLMVVLLVIMIVPSVQAQRLEGIVSPGIIINLPSRTLALYSGEQIVKEYPVTIGKPATPTPIGEFSVIEKEVNPVWIPPGRGYIVQSGPDNPLGYRWMGFLPLYGVHGTNAPWAIGLAVSNGCVRMLEEDAEELFEVVRYGTPVKVMYERVKVQIDDNGQASVGIYPDVYGLGPVNLTDVRNKLAQYGLDGMASDQFLLKQIRDEADKQVVFATFFNIKVNNNHLNEHGVIIDRTLYIPIWPVATAKKSNIIWDDATKTVKNDKQAATGIVMGNVIYVSLENLEKLYGGQLVWNSGDNTLEVNQINVLINENFFTSDVRTIDHVLAVPALPLANRLGYKSSLDTVKGTMVVDGIEAPVTMINDQAYLSITKINELFHAHVYWNEGRHTIEITFPLKNK